MSDEKPTSIWKKEISFRRKPAEEGAAVAEAGEPTSIWKKEISLRKKAKAVEAEAPVEAPEQALPSAAAAAPDPLLEAALEAISTPEPDPLPAGPAPHVQAVPPAPEHDWLTKPLEEVSEPPPEPVAPVSLAPVPPAPAFDPPVAAVAPVAPEAAETPTVVLPEVPVEPAWPGEDEVDPIPAAEAPAGKVPFYKKELSFRRGPTEPKEEGPKRERRRKEAVAVEDGAAKVPFYKRELSLKRPRKDWDPGEATTEVVEKPKAPRTSLALPSISLPSFSGGGGNAKGRVVGLKIGGSQIAAARIHNGDAPELVQAVRAPLEHGIVVNGELRDPEALAVALKEFFAEHKLPKRGVRLGIANNRIGVRTFDVIGIEDPKQLANAIRFRAQEVLPIPLEEAVLDYQVLAEGQTEEGQPLRRVLLVVAYRELVDRYVYACRKAGLQIVGIDLEAFALLRAVAPPRNSDGGPVAGSERGALVAVSVGHDRSTFAVSDGRVCEFTRVLEWGGWALNVAIARALDLSPSEVEPLKHALSFVGGDTAPEGFDESQLDTAREAARRQLQTFARELVSSLQFYQNQPGSLGIGEIALTGGTAHLPGLGAELERLIGVPVRVVDPLSRLRLAKRARHDAQVGSLAVAIGLGIED